MKKLYLLIAAIAVIFMTGCGDTDSTRYYGSNQPKPNPTVSPDTKITKIITGTLVYPDGTPIPGAKVFVNGIDTGKVTDENGKFEVSDLLESGTQVYVTFDKSLNYKFEELGFAVQNDNLPIDTGYM